MFGKAGREWLRSLKLPVEECETVESTVRQIEFLDAELAEVDRLIAKQVLMSGDARHLLSVPGVNVVCAVTLLGVIGDIRRFRTSGQLVVYLGLDPKVRQSGSDAALPGRISKQRSPRARWALVEATHGVIVQPGPLRALHQRIRAAAATRSRPSPRRGSSRACSGACSSATRTTRTRNHR
jgi:transposase